jgi:hypothetical protein
MNFNRCRDGVVALCLFGALSQLITGCMSSGISTTSMDSLAPDGSSGGSSGSGGGSSGGAGGGGGSSAPVAQVSVGAVQKQSLNLATSVSVPVTIQSLNGFAGEVNLAVDQKVLSANDPLGTISVSVAAGVTGPTGMVQTGSIASTGAPGVTGSSVTLTAGGSAQATVTITTTVSSPDLNSFVNLNASTSNGAVVVSQIPVQVNAIYEVDVDGPPGSIEKWSTPVGSTIEFTQHTGGVTLIFKNMDTTAPSNANKAHRIHSSGTAFLHEGDGAMGKSEGLGAVGTTSPATIDNPMPAPSAAPSGMPAETVGDTYIAIVTSQVPKISDTYYCHNHEDAATAGRKMVFNAFSAPTVIGNSGNPNASFKYITTNVITPMCASCHVTANPPDGGIDLSSYAAVIAGGTVQPGSPAGSSFYIQLGPDGDMPSTASGTRGTPVSAQLLQDISDWISDGAKNN